MHGPGSGRQALAGARALVSAASSASATKLRRLVSTATSDLSISFRVNQRGRTAMPASTSLLALAGIVGFALISMLLGVFS